LESRGRKNRPTNRRHGGKRDKDISWVKVGSRIISNDDIIGFIAGSDKEVSLQEILEFFNLGRGHRKTINAILQELCREKILVLTEDKLYRVLQSDLYHRATLSVNPRGFAFAQLTPVPREWKFKEEVFISPSHLGSAIHGDQVLVKITGHRDDRAEAKILQVLERTVNSVVGIFRDIKPFGLVTPEDERFPFTVRITEQTLDAQDGDAVVAVITDQDPGKLSHPKGRIIEVLGNPDSLKVQTEIVVRKFELAHEFSAKTIEQVRNIPPEIGMSGERTDLRDVLHITIDGETARDFDDAVAVHKTEKGFKLHVSIADVSHYVPEGSPLDQDAYARGTSVYFPTRVLPMLPEKLSNDLCSLVPNEDRYAFTAVLDFDPAGKLLGKFFTKSVINSRYRMTYNLVSQIIIEKDPQTREQYTPLLTPLGWMEELGHALLKQRMARGSIGFELPEAFVEVTDSDEVKDIARRERTFAHQIIEEFMLAANEAVARTMADNNLKKGLFRIHEPPDKTKVAEFKTFARTMGLKLPKGDETPRWFGEVIKATAGQPLEYIVNNLLLRTMKQARYSYENPGHFGLAASHYCHFTSPIRRYPDLMVHRALGEFLAKSTGMGKEAARKKKGSEPHEADDAGEFLSKRERVAVDAEREMVDRLKVIYMEDKVGETFAGIISGVTSFGLFVELLDSFVSGAVPITAMRDDYYNLDEKNHRLVGKRTHKLYQVGTLVTVRLTGVEKARRRINFELAAGSPNSAPA
jgi:ribonuclease R